MILGTVARASAVFIFLLGQASAQADPHPPCEGIPRPFYAAAEAQPNVEVLKGLDMKYWKSPGCIGWLEDERDMLVALAGTVPGHANAEELLRRLGAVSKLQGIRYWSVSDRSWRVLVNYAGALAGPDPDRHRADFSAEEMRDGMERYFVQSDTRSTSDVIYRMRVREATNSRIVLETENITPVRLFFFTVFKPGELKSACFLDRLPDGRWGYYSLMSASVSLAGGSEASFINRAVALYRHFIGVPTDHEPPLAP